MENKINIFSSFNDEDMNGNQFLRSNQTNNKFLNLPTLFKKTPSFSSEKERHSSETGINKSNYKANKSPKSINDAIKQYELHPFRQLNLKIIGEDIKKKIFEMNKEDNEDYDYKKIVRKSFSSKTQNNFKNKLDDNKHFNLTENNKNITNEERQEYTNIKNDYQYNNKNKTTKICLEIPQEIKRRKKKIRSKLIMQERKLNRIKNLYDSNDDDESGDDDDEYIINPETKIIFFFDLLILIFFIYYFIFTTFNLCQEKCFCSLNKRIKYSDVLLFINDIICIIDLIISFFRGYYDYSYKLIKSNKLILKHFLKYDFIFDLLSAIPFFSIIKYICLKSINNDKCFKYAMPNRYILIKLCFLLKAAKVTKILGNKKNQALDIFIESLSDNYTLERALVVFIYIIKYLGIFHFLVCIHIFIGNHSYSNWIIFTQSEDQSFFNIYIQSLYFIITTLTTVGYGDIVCKSLLERIFQIIILAIGSVFYPYVVSLIGNFIKNDSSAKIKHNNDLAMLENIRRNYPNISFKLYHKIHKYLESKSYSLEKFDVNSLIETLPFAMKNNILFTMYKNPISNFKFFKNNNNSVFIAQVLSNFIPSISKKNEFLVYEGEMLEEIIFLKDGKIAFNAAINMENPLKSINKYFFESFTPFTTEEEKKLINENINIKSNFSAGGEIITYDKAKNKLNNAFKNLNTEKNEEDKNQIKIKTNIKDETFDFDIKGGRITNDEGNYQYIKILEIRKNEHFGPVFMTLNKPCPLSLQVKSKIAELFLLKKEQALNLSKNYPNIWRKIYGREFHDLRKIKQYTITVLKKYIEANDIYMNDNIDDLKTTNNISFFEMNTLNKSSFIDKSLRKSNINKSFLSRKEDIDKNNILNYVSDKKNKNLYLDKIKSKMNKKNDVKRNSTYEPNKERNQIVNNNKLNLKFGSFLSVNKNANNFNKNVINSSKVSEDHKENKQEKLKKLKLFLIEYKKSLTNNNNLKEIKSPKINNEKNNLSIPKVPLKKSCLKSKTPENIKNNKSLNSLAKNVSFDLSSNKENKFNINEDLIKNLNDICSKETNFSFCSINEDDNIKFKELSIVKNSDFEFISSYPNFNELTKGEYSRDFNFQKKLKYILKEYYQYKNTNTNKESNLNNSLFQASLLPSDFENSLNLGENDNNKHDNKSKNKKKSTKLYKVKKYMKEKYNSFYGSNKLNKMNNRLKIIDEMKVNRTEILDEKSISEKKLSIDDEIEINNNLELVTTVKLGNKNLLLKESKDIFDSESVKVNKSFTSSSLKKSMKENFDENSNKKFIGLNKRLVSKINSKKEIEYNLDKEINKVKNNNNNSNKKINYKIFKNKKRKKDDKSKNKGKNEELINKMLGLKLINSKNGNNIITTSSNLKESKKDFNSVEKIKNIENVSIYNIIQKNINKNFNIIDKNEKDESKNINKGFCCII